MHAVQQVRLFRRSGETRRSLHTPSQCGQRKDLRFPLVLVCHPRLSYLHHAAVPARYNLLTKNASLHDENAISARAPRQRRHYCSPEQNGRLVPSLHPWRKPRLGHLQGYHARIREQAESQLSAPHPRYAGCVTSGARVGVPHLTTHPTASHGLASRLNIQQ